MAVGITLSRSANSHRPAEQEPSCCLQDNGYYWFLSPFFEGLAARTQQYIEPYGDAEFSGAQLEELQKTLEEARASAERHSETIDVKKKWWTPEPVFETIERNKLLTLLDQFDEVLRVARLDKRSIICSGD